MNLHHVLPMALAPRERLGDHRRGEKFAIRRMHHRRPIPIVGAVLVATVLLACEQGPAKPPAEHSHDPPATAEIKTVILTVGDRPFRQGGSGTAAASHTVPEITQAVIEDGAVLVHVKMASTSSWWPAPFSVIARSGTVELTCAFTEGTATIFITGTIVTRGIIDLFRGYKIRLTIIPPGGIVQ